MERTKADEIASSLEEAIVVGAIEPGTVLRQDQISAEYQVSRTPVREALRRLAALGLAEFLPNRGVRVRPLDAGEWREVYLARAALEGLAAEIAAPGMTEEQFTELEQAETEFRQCLEALRTDMGEPARHEMTFTWLQANVRFHDVILAASGSELVTRLARSVRRGFVGRPSWERGSEIDRLYLKLADQHTAIRLALRARSPRGARELSAEHVMDSWRLLELVLATSPERRGIGNGRPSRTPPKALPPDLSGRTNER